MKCIKCNTEYTGNFCPNCGTPSTTTRPTQKQGVLLGFRTNRGWKKFLSICYLIFWGIFAVAILSSARKGQVTTPDYIIDKVYDATLLIVFFSPFIFLSNTKFRSILPLFKQKKAGLSFVGMLIVVVSLFVCSGIINSLHSDEYKEDMENHAYAVISTVDASCTEDGETEYECAYCGLSKTETIEAKGHNMVESARTGASCEEAGSITYKCANCGEEKAEEVAVLGHNLKEVSRTDATCSAPGTITSKCENCGKDVTEEIAVLEHKFTEVSRTEATNTEDGEIRKKCDNCGEEKLEIIPCANPKGTEDNPYVFSAQELFDLSADGVSQTKYLDKYVEVSGTVLSISDYSSLKGYYLVGGAGAGVVCWVDSSKIEAQYGQSAVFIGKVTVADTKHIEISECKVKNVEWPTEKQLSPVSICDWRYTIDYVGGVEWNFKLKNNSDKTIKYVTMEWNCYNAVGDLIYDSITGRSSHSVKYTGPLEPGETTGSKRNTTLFYNSSYSSAKLTKLEVEFMDGTVIKINDQGYYDYIID